MRHTSMEALDEARKLGLDTVVIDHHQAPEQLPSARAIVNPNRQDDLSKLGYLAAVGVVFIVAVALLRELRKRRFWKETRREPDLLAYLDLVALGTVADVVPLKGLNRLCRQGLLAMRRREGVGLKALMDAARLDGRRRRSISDFSSGRASMPAADRRRHARHALLLTDDRPRHEDRARTRSPEYRARAVEGNARGSRSRGARCARAEERGAVVIASKDGWHPGVVGWSPGG